MHQVRILYSIIIVQDGCESDLIINTRSSHSSMKHYTTLIMYGALLLLTGVAAGAFGAHGLKRFVSAEALTIWQTGVLYQLVHGLGLLITAQLSITLKIGLLRIAAYIMLAGTLIFSGSLYVLVLTGVLWLGAITPIGGVLLLVAWALICIAAWRGKTQKLE